MKNVNANFAKWTMATTVAVFGMSSGTLGFVKAADLSDCQNAPMVKNMRSYSSHCSGVPANTPHELTRGDVKHLTATAKSAEDHLTIARYWEAEADKLESRAAGYEEAAAGYRHNPTTKNLMSPTAASNFDFQAKNFREEAKSDRALAAAQRQLAQTASTAAEAPRTTAGVTR